MERNGSKRTLLQYMFGDKNGDVRVLLTINAIVGILRLAQIFGR